MKEYSTALFIPTFPEAQALFKISKTRRITSNEKFGIYEIEHTSDNLLLIVSGMGQTQTIIAANFVFNNFVVEKIWLLGLCGALKENLKRPQAIIVSENKNLKNQSFFCSPLLQGKSKAIFEKAQTPFLEASALSANAVVSLPSEKFLLSENYLADVIEMEAFALAELCQQKNIPFAHLRWIFDEFSESIPDVSNFVDPWGKIKIAPLIFSLLKNPGLCFELLRLGKKTKISLEAMQHFLKFFLDFPL